MSADRRLYPGDGLCISVRQGQSALYLFVLGVAFGLAGCGFDAGRVSIILDNSTSMELTGTPFVAIKDALLEAVHVLPVGKELGLRVFDDETGSRLVAPYSRSLSTLESRLREITVQGGTYIGQSILAAATDLAEVNLGGRHLFLVTDGEGDEGDVEQARIARDQVLAGLPYSCRFIIFSRRGDVRTSTPIGRTAEALGCDLDVAGESVTSDALGSALYRAFGNIFFPIWLIISALLYFAVTVFTGRLLFATQIELGASPRIARVRGLAFVLILLPLVLAVHGFGLFLDGEGQGIVYVAGLALLILLGTAAFGNARKPSRDPISKPDDDPFA